MTRNWQTQVKEQGEGFQPWAWWFGPRTEQATLAADPQAPGSRPPAETDARIPTVFHITHWKSGSQWFKNILRALVPDRIVSPMQGPGCQAGTWTGPLQLLEQPVQAGMVYPTVYATREEFTRVALPEHCRFLILRDLRDTLVSLYFSARYSHPMVHEEARRVRAALWARDVEEGMLFLLREVLPLSADIQRSWLQAGEPFWRYEDFLGDDLALFEDLLLRRCRLDVTPQRLREVVLANRFEALTGGRRRGQEDKWAHERKGIRGDWRNHFTPRITRAFKERYAELLIATGYEDGANW